MTFNEERLSEPLTDSMIRALQVETTDHSNPFLYVDTGLALEGVEAGREACAEAINNARSAAGKSFVKVIA